MTLPPRTFRLFLTQSTRHPRPSKTPKRYPSGRVKYF